MTIEPLLARARDILKFRIERLLLRGMGVRLLLVALLIGAVSVVAGLLVNAVDGDMAHVGSAIWWAFLRLTDPGYLGDDQGIARRTVSTALTVAGYVLFMGALVAILTQWLNQTMSSLESGNTPIVQEDHVLVLGSTTRTAIIIAEMLTMAGRVRRFLDLHETRRVNLVVMLESLTPAARQDLRERVGPEWNERRIVMRSGSALRIDHLQRVDYLRASVILLPAEDLRADEGASDTRTIKTLMSMSKHSTTSIEELPLVVTEVFDARKIDVARRAYRGRVEIVASDQLVARLLALTVLFPGMSHVLSETLMYGDGNEVHVHDAGALIGSTVEEARRCFPRGIFLGLVRRDDNGHHSLLCPSDDIEIGDDHALVVLARSHEDAAPSAATVWDEVALIEPPPEREATLQRVLVVGWSDRVPDLVSELAAHGRPLAIDVLSVVPSHERQRWLDEHDLHGATVANIDGDIISPRVIARQNLPQYDVIVVMASDRVDSGSQSDARSILAYLLVRDVIDGLDTPPRMVVELMDDNNEPLVDAPGVEVIVSPLVVGRVLAHVALRPELRVVYDDMFAAGRAVLTIKANDAYGVLPRKLDRNALRAHVAAHGDVLMGTLDELGAQLNPVEDDTVELGDDTRFVILEQTS